MSVPKDEKTAKSLKIREQAMQVLRETRAKIDPVLLKLMKDKIAASGMVGKPTAGSPETSEKKGLFSAELVEAMSKKVPPVAPLKTSAANAAATYASAAKPAPVEAKADPSKPEMVPVDRQKITAIVMEYMRLREEKKPGH